MEILIDKTQEAELEKLGIPYDKKEYPLNSKITFFYSLFWSLSFLIAFPLATSLRGEWGNFWSGFSVILTSPANLITDYFHLGGIGATLFNAGICGLFCNLIVLLTRAKSTSSVLAGYFLVVAHCFYGLNILNMLPNFFGVFLFCLVTKRKISENIHIAMFSTSLAPFVSDFIFRYPLGNKLLIGGTQISLLGILLSLIFAIASGFIVPALLPGTTRMHRGFNLYKAGLSIGLFGLFVYALMYKTFGIEAPATVIEHNPLYDKNDSFFIIFMSVFFSLIFIASIIFGYILNGRTAKGYRDIFYSSGHNVDFAKHFGMPDCLINIGVYGFMILICFNLVFLLTQGVGYTGPSVGVTIAALTFSSSGQNPKNVSPIMLGYFIFYTFILVICTICRIEMPWSLSSQSYINGLAFATGLCPFSGKYGFKFGVLAGLTSAIICSSTSAIHGGFVLYNGGFTAGLTALILIPILDFYNVKEKAPTIKA